MARNDLVLELVGKAKVVSATLAEFKADAFGDIQAFVDMSAEQYNAKVGGKKGNITLMSFDGQYKIVRAAQDNIRFTGRHRQTQWRDSTCHDPLSTRPRCAA
ncbi:MAG: DUF3164 family protein [Pseudomonadales bacterium]